MFFKTDRQVITPFWNLRSSMASIQDKAERDLTVARLGTSLPYYDSISGLSEFLKNFPDYEKQILDGLLSGRMPFIRSVFDLETFCNNFPNYKKQIFEKIFAHRIIHFICNTQDFECFSKKFPDQIRPMMPLLLEGNLDFIRRVSDLVTLCNTVPEYEQKIIQRVLFTNKLTNLIRAPYDVYGFTKRFPGYIDAMMTSLLETNLGFISQPGILFELCNFVPKYKDRIIQRLFSNKSTSYILSVTDIKNFCAYFPEHFSSMMSVLLKTDMSFIYSPQCLEHLRQEVPLVLWPVIDKFLNDKKLFKRLFAFNDGSLSLDRLKEFYNLFPEYRNVAYDKGGEFGYNMPIPAVAGATAITAPSISTAAAPPAVVTAAVPNSISEGYQKLTQFLYGLFQPQQHGMTLPATAAGAPSNSAPLT